MKTKLLLSLALLVAACATAAEGYVLKSASGTTNATVYFPAGTATFRLVSLDVTADNATNTLLLAAGTTSANVIKTALSTATNVVCEKCTLASNDVVLFQNAAETVTAGTVWTNTLSTNKQIALQAMLGTNLAVEDVLRERLTTAYTVATAAAADATTYYVDATTGLAGGDIVVLYRNGLPYTSQTLDSTASVTNKRAALVTPVVHPVTIGDAIYERNGAVSTNVIGTTAYNGLSLCVAGTNGFAAADRVLIETVGGNRAVRTIDTDGTGTTNITLTVAPGFAVVSGDSVTLLTSQDYAAVWSAAAGDSSLLIDVATGLTNRDELVVVSTGYAPWRVKINGTPASETAKTIVVNSTFGVAVAAGEVLYEASQTACALTFTAASTAQSVICDVSTGLAAADRVILFPASGGLFENTVAAAGVDYPISTVSFTAATGAALAAGDSVWLLGTATSFPIGAATVRRDSSAIWTALRGRPVRAVLTGAAACSINNLTGVYGP